MTKERALAKSKQYREWATKKMEKAKEIYANYSAEMKDFDWTQPILKGHHSQRRHEKIYERRNSIHAKVNEMEAHAKRMFEKADNLEAFANTNKGDAERKRQAERDENDKNIKVGDMVKTIYGMKEVLKINKKTYTIKGESHNFTIDKAWIIK